MRVAILGNMNNNGFALLRYLLDLGCNARLLLYSTDGVGPLEHFRPEYDSFSYHKYQGFIDQTPIANTPYQAMRPSAAQALFGLLVAGRRGREAPGNPKAIASRADVARLLGPFDRIITSGYGPSILRRSGIAADIFSPYSIGIEGIGRLGYAPPAALVPQRLLWEYSRQLQRQALKRTRYILAADTGLTTQNAISLGLGNRLLNYQMPLVYPERYDMPSCGDARIDAAGRDLADCEFSVMMHSSLNWSSGKISKNNHWILLAFATLAQRYPARRLRLIMVEYGHDVERTKVLASQLGIAPLITWIPKTTRRCLMWLLHRVTVGCGEFIKLDRLLWGGTGLEVMAVGRPLLQGFFFGDGEYERAFGHDEPPLLKVRSEHDIADHLITLFENPGLANALGDSARNWFQAHNGIQLAKQWLDLLGGIQAQMSR